MHSPVGNHNDVVSPQFFEKPKELMGNEQPDDLLFFVINEAYQVITCIPGHHSHALPRSNPPSS